FYAVPCCCMYGVYSSYYPNSSGYLYESFKFTILILTPTCQRRLVPCPSRVSMCTRLYCASIVSCRQADCCDPIHHSLVVSGTPVRIRGRKSIRLHDSINYFPSTEIIFREVRCGFRNSPVC